MLLSMKKIKFTKMHGLGNDFIILDCRNDVEPPSADQIKKLSNRTLGVGCDQFIVLGEPSCQAEVFMRIFNGRDGLEAEACGNATRCVAWLEMLKSGTDACTVQTVAGLLVCERAGECLVKVNMGSYSQEWSDIPLLKEVDTRHLPLEKDTVSDPVAVTVGNPHCVFFVDDLVDLDVEKLGTYFEVHPLFPERTNVEFAQICAPDKIRMRVWERGEGITQACGTGACAVMVAAVQRGLADQKAEIILDGGSLEIEYEIGGDVLMTGPVAHVFDGTLENL